MNSSYRQQGPGVSRKPDRITAMQQIIDAVKQEFPLYQPDTFKCGPNNTCIGCPKKLMELVDTDLCYWQYQINRGIPILETWLSVCFLRHTFLDSLCSAPFLQQ